MVSTTFNIKHKGYYWWNMLVGNVKKAVFNNRKMLIKHCWWWLVYFSITQHNYNGILMYIDGWYIFLFMMMMVSMFHHWPLLILLMVVGWRFIVAFLWCYSRHRTGNNGIYNAYDVSPDDVRWPTEAGVLSGIQTWLENPTVCSMIFPANLPCYRGFSSHVWWLEATSIWRPTGVTSSFFLC
jgi:hypothetical protein